MTMPIYRLLVRFGFAVLLMALTPLTSRALPVVALFTDYGNDDPYVAQMKGAILTVNANLQLIDLTHNVSPYDIAEGAYLLDQSAQEFPSGTIFVAIVDPLVGTERAPILIQTNQGKFFIGPDNGLFTRVIDNEGLAKAWKLDKPLYYRAGITSHTFHGRDIFGPVAAHLAAGVDPEKIGTPLKDPVLLPIKEPSFGVGMISAGVVHIDHFGNVILDLRDTSDAAQKLKEGNLIKISVGKESYSAPLVKTFADVQKGHLALLYGGSGQLEIAMNQGSAAKQLKVEGPTTVLLKP